MFFTRCVSSRSVSSVLSAAALSALASVVFAGAASASTIIEPGFDLFQSTGSFFDFNTVPNPQVVNFQGEPLPAFDFGAGAVGIGDTDTIVERLTLADLGTGSDTINIEIVALSLVSTGPVDLGFGAGFENLFITLNTSSPSVQNTMTIFDTGEGSPHGTFDSFINFSFDVTGSVGGFYATIENSSSLSASSWQHAATGGPVLDGVNHLLDGGSENGDIWLIGSGEGVFGGTVSTVPEPGTALLVGIGLIGLAARSRSKHRSTRPASTHRSD